MANKRNNEKDGKKMTVREFCLYKTKVNELCAIVDDSGYIIATVWIDIEDLFVMDDKLSMQIVERDAWETIQIVTEHNDRISIPCHYIYLANDARGSK